MQDPEFQKLKDQDDKDRRNVVLAAFQQKRIDDKEAAFDELLGRQNEFLSYLKGFYMSQLEEDDRNNTEMYEE